MKYLINKDTLIDLVVTMIEKEIQDYYIEKKSKKYALNDKEGRCLINYVPSGKELYYDHSLWEYVSQFIPIGYEPDTFKEGVKKYFNIQFPELLVKRVTGANIVTF